MRDLHFKDYFWNPELTSTRGYNAIIQHLNDGKRTCKEVEDFMKARASIEEKYAKDLLGLSKKVCGHSEMNLWFKTLEMAVQEEEESPDSTLKRSLDVFKLHTENVSLSHLQLAHSMREEAKKLEDFREKQKEARKKVETQMEALHKQKVTQFKKTIDSKKTYENKCREKEEAEQNMNRNTNTTNTKQIEKLYSKAQQAKQIADEADRVYMQNIGMLGKIREDWLMEHSKACDMFERQEVERINMLRNSVWTHLNQLSQQSVTSDELNEEVRKSLEQCDIREDIEHFVELRRTGEKQPAPVMYENFYSGQKVPAAAAASRQPPPIVRRGPLPKPTRNEEDHQLYSAVPDPAYSVIQ